ncbi:hypothetical protein B0H15DRAFT_796638 [Mycena belliarum]|uniref:Uncharacterized protein n=1 Tax=Mycena belliarum TaxID=1033014 RepID=A0AAD6UD90_9AGAR|nr:hypothetical protein B0H15DRAFT_796638 [Mycena belliae]
MDTSSSPGPVGPTHLGPVALQRKRVLRERLSALLDAGPHTGELGVPFQALSTPESADMCLPQQDLGPAVSKRRRTLAERLSEPPDSELCAAPMSSEPQPSSEPQARRTLGERFSSPSDPDVLPRLVSASSEPQARRPRYLRDFVWTGFDEDYSPTAASTEYDPPLPRPPQHEYTPVALKTLADHPDLFRIVSPIDADAFEGLLADHPNQPFVRSVVSGLREGFWPWVDTQPGIYPETHDSSDFPLKDERERLFVRQQRDDEIALGRFSPSFGRDLFPGMYSMPIHAVPKPGSQKLRLVVNHSMGEHSLNSMIPRHLIAGSRLDTLKNLGDHLLALRGVHGHRKETRASYMKGGRRTHDPSSKSSIRHCPRHRSIL